MPFSSSAAGRGFGIEPFSSSAAGRGFGIEPYPFSVAGRGFGIEPFSGDWEVGLFLCATPLEEHVSLRVSGAEHLLNRIAAGGAYHPAVGKRLQITGVGKCESSSSSHRRRSVCRSLGRDGRAGEALEGREGSVY